MHPKPTLATNADYAPRVANAIDAIDRRLKGNLLDNGAFPVWQKGTSIAVAGARTYGADRWANYRTGFVTGCTVSRQTGGQAQYCARVQRDSGNASTATISFVESIETVNCIPLRSRYVKLKFRARKGVDYSAASALLTVAINTGTGTDEANDFAYTGLVATSEGKTLTSSFQDFEMTALLLPSNVSEIAVAFQFNPVGSASTNDYFEVEEIQFVPGEYAGEFPYKSLAEERMNCKAHLRVEDFRIPATTAVSERIGMRKVPTITGGGAGYTSTGTTADAIVHFQTAGAVATLTLDANI